MGGGGCLKKARKVPKIKINTQEGRKDNKDGQ